MQEHRPKAQSVDRAIAALIRTSSSAACWNQRWSPSAPSSAARPWTDSTGTQGRNHYAKAFTALACGCRRQGRLRYGETDEFGINIVENPVHVHDYHATILHLMGIDHTRLVYRYAGRDFRLTDVDGNVIKAILS